MNKLIKQTAMSLVLGLSLCSLSSLTLALPADFDAKMAARPQADKDRDAGRKPKETVIELGIQEGWTVVDVAAGGGWFTRVLSAAVGPKGKVIAQFGALRQGNTGQAQKDMAQQLGNVETVFESTDKIAANSADAAVTAMNLHDALNFGGEAGGQKFISDIFAVLKPGGVAAIIDHAGTEGADNKTLHRVTAAAAKTLIQKAGFEIVKESKLLANAKDDHTQGSHGMATDQFLFVVRKPAK